MTERIPMAFLPVLCAAHAVAEKLSKKFGGAFNALVPEAVFDGMINFIHGGGIKRRMVSHKPPLVDRVFMRETGIAEAFYRVTVSWREVERARRSLEDEELLEFIRDLEAGACRALEWWVKGAPLLISAHFAFTPDELSPTGRKKKRDREKAWEDWVAILNAIHSGREVTFFGQIEPVECASSALPVSRMQPEWGKAKDRLIMPSTSWVQPRALTACNETSAPEPKQPMPTPIVIPPRVESKRWASRAAGPMAARLIEDLWIMQCVAGRPLVMDEINAVIGRYGDGDSRWVLKRRKSLLQAQWIRRSSVGDYVTFAVSREPVHIRWDGVSPWHVDSLTPEGAEELLARITQRTIGHLIADFGKAMLR